MFRAKSAGNSSGNLEDKLYHAIKKEQLEEIKALVTQGANIEHRYKHHGATPLYVATVLQYEEGVELLIKLGADVNKHAMISNDGKFSNIATGFLYAATPLHAVAISGNVRIAILLLAAKADCKAKAFVPRSASQGSQMLSGVTPFQLAGMHNNYTIQDLIGQKQAQIAEKKQAKHKVMEILLKNMALLNAKIEQLTLEVKQLKAEESLSEEAEESLSEETEESLSEEDNVANRPSSMGLFSK